jgi:hypothetical protein
MTFVTSPINPRFSLRYKDLFPIWNQGVSSGNCQVHGTRWVAKRSSSIRGEILRALSRNSSVFQILCHFLQALEWDKVQLKVLTKKEGELLLAGTAVVVVYVQLQARAQVFPQLYWRGREQVNSVFVSPPYRACSPPRRNYNLISTYRSSQLCLQVHFTNRPSVSTS